MLFKFLIMQYLDEIKRFSNLFLPLSSQAATGTFLTRENWDLGHPRGLLGWGPQDQVLFQLRSAALWGILIELHFSEELNELKDCELYHRQSWLTSFTKSWERTLWSLFSAFPKRIFLMFSKGSFARNVQNTSHKILLKFENYEKG